MSRFPHFTLENAVKSARGGSIRTTDLFQVLKTYKSFEINDLFEIAENFKTIFNNFQACNVLVGFVVKEAAFEAWLSYFSCAVDILNASTKEVEEDIDYGDLLLK